MNIGSYDHFKVVWRILSLINFGRPLTLWRGGNLFLFHSNHFVFDTFLFIFEDFNVKRKAPSRYLQYEISSHSSFLLIKTFWSWALFRQVTGEIGFLSSIILSLSSQGSTIQLSVDDVSKNSNDLDFKKWHENMLVKIESQVHRPHPPKTYILYRKSK